MNEDANVFKSMPFKELEWMVKICATFWLLIVVTCVLAFFAGRMSARVDVKLEPVINVDAPVPAKIVLDGSTLKLPEAKAPVFYLLLPKVDGETKVTQVPVETKLAFPEHLKLRIDNLKDLMPALSPAAPAKPEATPNVKPAAASGAKSAVATDTKDEFGEKLPPPSNVSIEKK